MVYSQCLCLCLAGNTSLWSSQRSQDVIGLVAVSRHFQLRVRLLATTASNRDTGSGEKLTGHEGAGGDLLIIRSRLLAAG